jgi:transcriptional regulator GlxA family with amidase domain
VAAARSDAEGDEAVFVLLDDGRLIPVHGAQEAMEAAARALEGELHTPYRALAVRREGDAWAVGAVGIEVAELPADTEGSELLLTVTEEGERALEIDGRPTLEGIEPIELAVSGRYDAYVLRGTRLDERLWEIGIDPL